MYKVKNGESEVYAYSKYLVDTFPLAMAYYNENGVYDTHKDRKYRYELYGGYAGNLDYYPYEKEEFVDNLFVDDAKAYYLVGTKYVLAEVDKYIALAKQAGATAFVVDIKDGALAYQSTVAQTYTPTSYAYAMNSTDNYAAAIKKIKDAGFYVIGRIVLFNDSTFAKDNPNDCITKPNGTKTEWVSAYSRRAWEYNVRLALEAIELFDFNEIQFDYVRFPEASYNWSKNGYNFVNTYNEEKAQAIQNFLFYATDEIHKTNTYISIDVFGECSSTYVTAYGQYWPAISNIVDVVSIDKEWKQDDSNLQYISKSYKIEAPAPIENYEVEIKGENIPKGLKVTNKENKENKMFSQNEEFKILIPVTELNKAGGFEIEIKTKINTKPVLYGYSGTTELQSYALTTLKYEDSIGNYSENYPKNEAKITILKQEKDTNKPLEGVEFQLLNTEEKIVYQSLITNENGEIVIENILPGKYYLKEVRTLEGYVPYNEKIEIDVHVNEQINVTVNNSKEKNIEVSKDVTGDGQNLFVNKFNMNYVFFINDLIEGWNSYFCEDFPQSKLLITDEEQKNQNIEIEEKETIEQIFENWIIGKPYISDNLIEVPVRIFCKPGKIDVIMYMNTQEPSALYQINFTKWNKNDE